MKAFPVTENMYKHRRILADQLGTTSQASGKHPAWELYEESITPPSLINKLSLHRKHTITTNTLLANLLKTEDNFLTKEVLQIHREWKMSVMKSLILKKHPHEVYLSSVLSDAENRMLKTALLETT